MGSWADLTLDNDVMDGIAPVDLRDPNFDSYDTDAISANMRDEAKGYIEMKSMREFPEMMRDADGPGEFFDAAIDVGKTHLTGAVNRTLGYCVMWQYYEQQALASNSMLVNRSAMMYDRFEMAFNALIKQLRIDSDFLTQLETTVDDDMDTHSQDTWVG